MRKLILLATVLAPFAAGSAFAGSSITAGDANSSKTSASSGAELGSVQGTYSQSTAMHGSTIGGAVSGNYTTINTSANAQIAKGNPSTTTGGTQLNVGGTISGGTANGKSSTVSGGTQSSTDYGFSTASASNQNVGGFTVQKMSGK